MDPALIPVIERALEGLEFGTVQLVVHNSQLVRIERLERIRLTDAVGSPDITQRQTTRTREDGDDTRAA